MWCGVDRDEQSGRMYTFTVTPLELGHAVDPTSSMDGKEVAAIDNKPNMVRRDASVSMRSTSPVMVSNIILESPSMFQQSPDPTQVQKGCSAIFALPLDAWEKKQLQQRKQNLHSLCLGLQAFSDEQRSKVLQASTQKQDQNPPPPTQEQPTQRERDKATTSEWEE